VLAFRLLPITFTGAPFRLQTICRSGVPPRSGTTTALLTALPRPLTGLRGPTSKGRGRKGEEKGEGRNGERRGKGQGREGTPPNANSWIRL